jgi:multiple sugar transport system substrate-binding protein
VQIEDKEPARLMDLLHTCRAAIRPALATAAFVGLGTIAVPAFADSDVTLSYAMWDQAQMPAMQQIISEFHQAHPNINVKIQLTPWSDYWTKLRTAATGGSAPDVFWMTVAYFKYYAGGGVLMQLDDLAKNDGIDMSVYVPAITQAYQYDGKTFGIPKDVNSFGLFYNKNLFKAEGVSLPTNSWTWDDVVSAAKKLTDPTRGTYGIVAADADELTWYLTVPQAGGAVISADGKKSGYDAANTIKGVQFWVDMVNKYHVSPNLQQTTDTDPLSLFTSGKVALYYGGSWDPVAIAQVPDAKAFTGVVRMPKGDTSKFYSNGLANAIYVNTPHPQEAWEFVKFLSSKRANEIQSTTGTVIPAYQGQADNYIKGLSWLDAKVLIDQLPDAVPFPSSENTPVWRQFATKELASAWAGNESVAEAAKKIADHMNAALANERQGQ